MRAKVVALVSLFHTIKKLKLSSNSAACNLELEENILQELLCFCQQHLQNDKDSFDINLLLQTELNGNEPVNLSQLIYLPEVMIEKGHLSFLNYIVRFIEVGLHSNNHASDRKSIISLLVKLFLPICHRHKARLLMYNPYFILPLVEKLPFN